MKTTMLNYEEVKELLLQGYKVKLPEWQGYWKMNERQDGIEVHTKKGEILGTPNIIYTFHNNWEIATIDNCPVLKKEEEVKGNNKVDLKIIDIATIEHPFFGATPIVVVKVEGEERPKILRLLEFKELAGGRVEAVKMAMDFTLSKMPEELREVFSSLGIIDELNNMVNLVEKLEEEEEEEVDMEETDGDIEEFEKFLGNIIGRALRRKL